MADAEAVLLVRGPLHNGRKTLIVTGKAAEGERETREFLHRGIAKRAFERRFQLADHVRAESATVENGLLHVDLVREVPEALKPRRIEIAGATAVADALDKGMADDIAREALRLGAQKLPVLTRIVHREDW